MPADGCDLRACRGGARAAASLRGSPLLGGEGAGAPSRAHRRCAARRRAWELPQPARAASAGCAPPGRAGGPPGPDRRHGRQRAALTPQMLCGAGRRPKKWSAPKKWGAPRLRAALWAVAGAFPLAFPGARETRFRGMETGVSLPWGVEVNVTTRGDKVCHLNRVTSFVTSVSSQD